jgi:3D (Asp-Asp-Asp) domain-containing protein
MITNILTAVVTAYVWTGQPCADMHWPTAGLTVALPRRFPLGSIVEINGHRYIGHDRTHYRFDGRFDIFMASRQAAKQHGKQLCMVKVIHP